ncbi:serine hydrolase domain-containing protein [Steroidobacter sp.]|uniref:serine hydrolase domain-containing protein n=1 Tax=Steroidobacter sp. TaxID=1978227 RepID=UPI001A483D8D|nr:serine hydrolase domain-containing protein [Steroidobacter sp.]MBL8269067.1 serine hydrolase [Steroidobacter sp.]
MQRSVASWVSMRVGLLLLLLASGGVQASALSATTEAAIDALFVDLTAPGSPGAAVGIYRGGRVVFAKGYGLADLESGAPITPQTPFHVASMSKQFAAFAIALLAREGKVDLDADVRTYLPYFPDLGVKITTRQLIWHTSGLRDQMTLFLLGGHDIRDVLRQDHVIEMVKRQKALDFAPGTNFKYSNTGYTLLAEIVRSVTGKTLRQFTAERMFTPLGMKHTFFYDDVREVVPARAHSYFREGDGPWQRYLLNLEMVGASNLITTIEDLAQWAGNFSQPRVGDAALIEQIMRGGTLNDGTPTHYGFGLFEPFIFDAPLAGRRAMGHSGSDAMFFTYFVYYPEHDVAISMLANTPTEVAAKINAIADLYLPPNAAPVNRVSDIIKAPPPAQLDQLVGTYLHAANRSVTLERKGNRLVGRERYSHEVFDVVFHADGGFEVGARRRHYYRAVRAANGQVEALDRVIISGAPGERFQRVTRVTSRPAELARLAGDYYSDELDITYTVAVEQGQLVARSMRLVDPVRLTQVTANHFDSETFRPTLIAFERNASGEATGLSMDSVGLKLRRVPHP